MKGTFFQEFPAVWDAFEKQLRKKILEWLAVMLASEDGKKVGKLSGVYEDLGVTLWECRNCGHLVMGVKAPEVCPVCAHPQAFFEVRAENY